MLRTHNAEGTGSIPSLARTFNSFEKPLTFWKSFRLFLWNLTVRFSIKPSWKVFQRSKVGSLYGTSWKTFLSSPKNLSFLECRRSSRNPISHGVKSLVRLKGYATCRIRMSSLTVRLITFVMTGFRQFKTLLQTMWEQILIKTIKHFNNRRIFTCKLYIRNMRQYHRLACMKNM